VRCSFRGSLTRGSGLSLRAAAAVRGRVQRPRRGWDRWSCWHRASDLQRIPGGKSSAGAAACRRCPRGASSSWGAYAAAHRRRIIRLSPVVLCGGPTLWGIPVGAIGWFRVFSRYVAGAPGPGDAVCGLSPLPRATTDPRALPSPGGPAVTVLGTWLILPVVICLSQRLSHACLSISKSIR
jgi:hypothetical protein